MTGLWGSGRLLFRRLALRLRLALSFAFRLRFAGGAWRLVSGLRIRLVSRFGIVGHIPSTALELHGRRMQNPLDLASAFGTLRIRRGNALNLLKPVMTFLALELVKRHGSL